MSIEVLDLIAHGTLFAATGLSGLCIAAVFWMQHRQGANKLRSRSSNSLIFGQWPSTPCPKICTADNNVAAPSPATYPGRPGRSVGSPAPAGPFPIINRTQIQTVSPHRQAFGSSPQTERTAE